MPKISDSEWNVLDILWSGEQFSLGEITNELKPVLNWTSKTVYTYLTRMAAKGLVSIERGGAKPYSALISREECAKQERNALLTTVYRGSAGELVAAFLKESHIDSEERARLKTLLDEMEV